MRAIIVYLIALGFIISIAVWSVARYINLGDKSSDYDIICVYGHEYIRASFFQKGFLAIRLSDDGKPIRCENE